MRVRRKELCRAGLILETIKKTKSKGGMTSAQIKLAEAQAEDYASMKQEIKEIKTDVGELKREVGDVKVKIADIGGKVDILVNQKRLTDNKYFWIVIMLIMVLIAGVNHLSELSKLIGGL